MAKSTAVLILLFCKFAIPATPTTINSEPQTQWLTAKDSRNVFVTFDRGSTLKVIRNLDLDALPSRGQRIATLVSELKLNAARFQQPIIEFLEKENHQTVTVKSFWITNQLFIKGASQELIEKLRTFTVITKIEEEQNSVLDRVIDGLATARPLNSELQWGVVKVDAPGAWAEGHNGSGVVVATMDTGARVSHEALKDNYIGDYGWFDPYNGEPTPVDEAGHGSHILGTIVGRHGIGVAPGAKWMTCRACYKGFCTEEAMLTCGQFLLCPTDAQGQNADCSKAPNIISNSFGGGQGRDLLWPVFDAWQAAGIIIVFSNGNSGPFCETANSHADAPQVIGVGGTDTNDNLYVRSSVGPSVYGTLKPDIAAPGVDVVSAYYTSDDAYYKMSGTSMAAPHVAGSICILLSHTPGLSQSEALDLLSQGSETNLPVTGKNCGGIPEDVFPNHTYGRGRVNVLKSLKRLHARS